jgi:hypothetical protein
MKVDSRPSQKDERSVERRSADFSSDLPKSVEEHLLVDDSFFKSPELPSKTSLQQKPQDISFKLSSINSKHLNANGMGLAPLKGPGGKTASRGLRNLG